MFLRDISQPFGPLARRERRDVPAVESDRPAGDGENAAERFEEGRFVGPDNRRVVPLSAALGAAFLMLADDLAKTLASSFEIPVGIFTSLIGIPFFIFLLRRSKRVWS